MTQPSPLSAIVVDDEEACASKWADELAAGAERAGVPIEITALHGDDLAREVAALATRQRAFSSKEEWDEDGGLDGCDLLIVDADLRYVKGPLLATGETVVYVARCFADIGATALLNTYGPNSFDLTLAGRPTVFADALIGSEQIGAPGLWRDPVGDEFRPWSWPLLQRAAESQRARVAALDGRMDEPITEILRFDEPEIQAVERSLAAFLLDERKAAPHLSELTVSQFVAESEYALSRRDADALDLDQAQHQDVARRVGAARIGHWVNRILSPTQDLLADAPHLAEEFPSLLTAKDTPEDLRGVVQLDLLRDSSAAAIHEAVGFLDGATTEHAFSANEWADRPLWWGRRMRRADLPEVHRPWEHQRLPLRFCEDESGFRENGDAIPFACDLATPFRIRYVNPPGHAEVSYRPKENLVAAGG